MFGTIYLTHASTNLVKCDIAKSAGSVLPFPVWAVIITCFPLRIPLIANFWKSDKVKGQRANIEANSGVSALKLSLQIFVVSGYLLLIIF